MSAIEELEDRALAVDIAEAEKPSPIVALAKGKLDWSPKKNWVEEEGGLPKGIESMAVHMMSESGLTREHAIAASVQRAKVLAAKGEARWIKEVAQWEKMKSNRHAKSAAKQ
jgi:hypothetical protein